MHCGIVLIGEIKRSNGDDAWYPCIGNPLNFLDEFTTRDLGGTNSLLGICCDWRVFIGIVEWVPQKHDIRGLKRSESLRRYLVCAKDDPGSTYRLHIGISQSYGCRRFAVRSRSWPSLHVDYNDKFDAGISQPAIHGQSLVNSLEKSEVLIGCLMR